MGGTIDAYFVNVSGPNKLCGNVNTLQNVTEHSYTCSGWTMPTGQTYIFTVAAANCGGSLIGPPSGPVIVTLQGMLTQGFVYVVVELSLLTFDSLCRTTCT